MLQKFFYSVFMRKNYQMSLLPEIPKEFGYSKIYNSGEGNTSDVAFYAERL